MFLKFIKNFGLKKIIKKSLANYQPGAVPDAVTTIGVLIDEPYYKHSKAIVKELVQHGIAEENIALLVYKERANTKETVKGYYTYKDIAANGSLQGEAAAFTGKQYNMLISYYDEEKLPLLLATIQSRAGFKAGFSGIDKRLNHFTVNTDADNYTVFMTELLKYLKILNKI